MIDDVVFTPEAEDDIVHAYAWYQQQLLGLGEQFLGCVRNGITLIRQHPKLYRFAVGEFRRAVIRRFPFEIFYAEHGRQIVIYSVFHCSQHPDKWRHRLGDRPT